jgi:carboxymethylenebutenolidase
MDENERPAVSVDDVRIQAQVAGASPALRGVLARPQGDGPWPGVVMLHEAFGVDDVMRRQAHTLASSGYVVLLPDLFSAGGPRRCLVATFRALVKGQGRAFADIEASRRHLLARPDCSGRVGVIGFCMGGGFALLAATRDFDVSAPNYGVLPRDLDRAMSGACPVVASYGGRDRMLRGAAGKLDQALERAGVPHDVHEYPAAGHSFLNDSEAGPGWMRPLMRVSGAGPEPESARDAWARIEAFFAEHLR